MLPEYCQSLGWKEYCWKKMWSFLWYNLIHAFFLRLYLYVSQALCFTWVEVGYLIAVISVMHAIGSPAAVRLLTGRIRDSGIMALAALDGIIGQIYLIIPVMSVIYVYFRRLINDSSIKLTIWLAFNISTLLQWVMTHNLLKYSQS